jgi:hypothetical protein
MPCLLPEFCAYLVATYGSQMLTLVRPSGMLMEAFALFPSGTLMSHNLFAALMPTSARSVRFRLLENKGLYVCSSAEQRMHNHPLLYDTLMLLMELQRGMVCLLNFPSRDEQI